MENSCNGNSQRRKIMEALYICIQARRENLTLIPEFDITSFSPAQPRAVM